MLCKCRNDKAASVTRPPSTSITACGPQICGAGYVCVGTQCVLCSSLSQGDPALNSASCNPSEGPLDPSDSFQGGLDPDNPSEDFLNPSQGVLDPNEIDTNTPVQWLNFTGERGGFTFTGTNPTDADFSAAEITYGEHRGSYLYTCKNGTEIINSKSPARLLDNPEDVRYLRDTVCRTSLPEPTLPVDGSCGFAVDTCDTGVPEDVADTTAQYRWRCVGSNGGRTISCNRNKTNSILNQEGVEHYTVSSGPSGLTYTPTTRQQDSFFSAIMLSNGSYLYLCTENNVQVVNRNSPAALFSSVGSLTELRNTICEPVQSDF